MVIGVPRTLSPRSGEMFIAPQGLDIQSSGGAKHVAHKWALWICNSRVSINISCLRHSGHHSDSAATNAAFESADKSALSKGSRLLRFQRRPNRARNVVGVSFRV